MLVMLSAGIVGCGSSSEEGSVAVLQIQESLATDTDFPTPTYTPYPTYTYGKIATATPKLLHSYTVISGYRVPNIEFQRYLAKGSSGADSTILHQFRQRDLQYFLFNPPTEFENPSHSEWQKKYQTWDETSKKMSSKYTAVIDALTVWESGDSAAIATMTPEQLGYVMVFHPEYPNSPWNHPLQCQDIEISGDTYVESFCRWRNLIHLAGFYGFPAFSNDTFRVFERSKNELILSERTSGRTHGETLRILVDH